MLTSKKIFLGVTKAVLGQFAGTSLFSKASEDMNMGAASLHEPWHFTAAIITFTNRP